jgi:hypothetical protein
VKNARNYNVEKQYSNNRSMAIIKKIIRFRIIYKRVKKNLISEIGG